jgi:colicin import membrane protein
MKNISDNTVLRIRVPKALYESIKSQLSILSEGAKKEDKKKEADAKKKKEAEAKKKKEAEAKKKKEAEAKKKKEAAAKKK